MARVLARMNIAILWSRNGDDNGICQESMTTRRYGWHPVSNVQLRVCILVVLLIKSSNIPCNLSRSFPPPFLYLYRNFLFIYSAFKLVYFSPYVSLSVLLLYSSPLNSVDLIEFGSRTNLVLIFYRNFFIYRSFIFDIPVFK